MSKKKIWMIAALSNFICVLCMMIYMFGGIAQVTCRGFGIDSSGVLYLGYTERIVKYSDGKTIGAISRLPRGYAFEILEDDTILCTNSSYSCILDLNGNELYKTKSAGIKEVNRILRNKKHFTSSDGKGYEMRSPFGRRIIESEEGEVIWKMPIGDWLVFVFALISFLAVLGCNMILIYHYGLKKDWKL